MNEPRAHWNDSTVAILGPNSVPVGTGFIATVYGHIVTCAHVLDAAGWPYQAWDTPISVRLKSTQRWHAARVVPDCYQPQNAGDIAILMLQKPPATLPAPLPLVEVSIPTGRNVNIWGYPRNNHSGLFAAGEVRGHVSRGGFNRLQFWSEEATHGFSGGPLWDVEQEGVIGVVLAGEEADKAGRMAFTAYAIPAALVAATCSEIPLITPRPRRLESVLARWGIRPAHALLTVATATLLLALLLAAQLLRPIVRDWGLAAATAADVADLGNYLMDQHEVSRERFCACVEAGECAQVDGLRCADLGNASQLPVVAMSPQNANAFCRWQGGELPTITQWLLAVEGVNGSRIQPWGDEAATPNHLQMALSNFRPLPSDPFIPVNDERVVAGNTPEGIMQLYGNAAELTRTQVPCDCSEESCITWDGVASATLCVMGGSATDSYNITSQRPPPFLLDSERSNPEIGFRCVYAADSR